MAPVHIETGVQAAGGRIRERQQAKLAAHVNNSKSAMLELDETGETLSIWYWPVNDDGERVVPSDLVAYRKSHQFRGPYCLCAITEDRDFNNHREAAMVMLTRGLNAGEHVACCALSRCGYFASDEARLQEIVFVDGKDIKLNLIHMCQLRRNDTHKTFDRLLRLDSFTRPGLTEDEFHGFLTRCNGCELIMTRRMFECHNCVGKAERGDVEVIDLTTEDD
ncbi:hypothetical protein K503DRAFT_787415 [Rhizopogon vinicolor AM-OR11-026]|uniref:Uncharacterized protein n=1 Tax=Rhizopogon vinicolor AM-OR11-026 TaxID=1314800 RepID=A0A1B7MHP4_9AGAM|nr:hypothetical protein K503DRAFT_787415 [Rhizopogon vinicolor AM-OR11-026]